MSRHNIDSETMIMNRDQVIIRTSVIGILANVFLAAFKAAVGIASHSIAVILDAVNNLSDALSSIITIIGTKLAGKQPDKKHPFGHGRVEYLSAMIVSGIVLYAGITSAVESVKKIIHPEKPDYSILSLVIIAVAVAVKIILGRYVRAKGEAWVGVFISVIIIKSGIEMMMETLNEILGARADKETTDQIKQLLTEDPEVHGAYDLILHNYGPDKNLASVHLELPDTMTVREVDRLSRKLEKRVYKETGVILTGVGVYSYNTGDDVAAVIQNHIQEIVLAHDWAVQMHGFYVDVETKELTFDVVLSFEISQQEALAVLYEETRRAYPEYKIMIAPDVDISVTE